MPDYWQNIIHVAFAENFGIFLTQMRHLESFDVICTLVFSLLWGMLTNNIRSKRWLFLRLTYGFGHFHSDSLQALDGKGLWHSAHSWILSGTFLLEATLGLHWEWVFLLQKAAFDLWLLLGNLLRVGWGYDFLEMRVVRRLLLFLQKGREAAPIFTLMLLIFGGRD